MLSVTYNAFLHIPSTFIYVSYYLNAITFMPSSLLLVVYTLFQIHTFIISTLFSSFFHLQWFQYYFFKVHWKKNTLLLRNINKCFSLHVIDLLHLSSHVFILFYIFSFFKHFPSLYVPWKTNYYALHITSCFFRMSMKKLQFQSLFTCLTYNPFMYLEKKYYHVLHIASHFFRMSMKKVQFQCLLHVLHITWCF